MFVYRYDRYPDNVRVHRFEKHCGDTKVLAVDFWDACQHWHESSLLLRPKNPIREASFIVGMSFMEVVELLNLPSSGDGHKLMDRVFYPACRMGATLPSAAGEMVKAYEDMKKSHKYKIEWPLWWSDRDRRGLGWWENE